ncbi:hypothetical protein ACP4OV_013031 [Aristida adscensionis]
MSPPPRRTPPAPPLPLPPPYTYDEVPPNWPAGLPPPITCPGRPLRYFLPRSAAANLPPRAPGAGGGGGGAVPIQLRHTWLMLLGLPVHLSTDDLVERAISNFAALLRVDRSYEPVVLGVPRLICEVLVVDVSEIPHVLAITFDNDPSGEELEVTLVPLRRSADAAGGDGGGDGVAAGGRGAGGGQGSWRQQ